MPNAAISPAAIVVSAGISTAQVFPINRALYLYENDGVQTETPAVGSNARDLYLYENDGIQALSVLERALYLYENDGIQALVVSARALYGYEATHDLPVVPFLLQLVPTQQFPSGTVDLYGDGLGQYTEVGAAATITASSTNGTNVPANVVARSMTQYWQSTSGTSAWIRFTFGTAQTVYAIALEDLNPDIAGVNLQWGIPLFRFSDGGSDVVGGSAVPVPTDNEADSTYYPVGAVRTVYVLPTERTGITWVEVRVSSGGLGTNRGLSQAWVYADQGQAAETSVIDLVAEACGVVGTWLNRSPGWYPANSGLPVAKAVTLVVPADGVSGLVTVHES